MGPSVARASRPSSDPPLTAKISSVIEPRELGVVLLGPYVLGVELASMLLLAGLVGAYHLGRREEDAR